MQSTQPATPPPPPASTFESSGATDPGIRARRRHAHEGEGREAPGPRGLPVVGAAPAIARKGLFRFLNECWRAYGDTFRIPAPGIPQLVVSHPDQMERVLASNRSNYIKGPAYDIVRDMLGNGLLTSEGEPWKKRRRLAQPSFHRRSVESLVESMVEMAARYYDDLARRAPGGKVVDVHREMTTLTLDVVVEALFGRGLSAEAKVPYEVLSDALIVVGNRGGGVPLPLWLPTPGNIKFNRTARILDDAVYRVIGAARARHERGDEDGAGTLLTMLLDARDEETGEALTDSELRDEAVTLFVAGHETTALTMTWLFTLLEQAPEVVDNLRDETERVLSGRDPTFEDVPKLVYTRQVIDEVLRLRPPAWIVARNVLEDDNLGGYRVGKGEMCIPAIYFTHRHPDFWPDAERFDPERFSASNKKGRENWAYVPFSGGPRVCIGNTFSLVESAVLIAMLVQRFSFERVPGERVVPRAVGTLRPSGPVHVRLTPR